MEDEKQFAIEVVSKAAELTKKLQQENASKQFEKDDKSPVTAADFSSQLLVMHFLQKHFPNDALIGEENILELSQGKKHILAEITARLHETIKDFSFDHLVTREAENQKKIPGHRYWAIDPIDGTKGFLRGEQFAIALALMEDHVPVLGVLGCPNLNLQAQPTVNGPGIVAYAVRGKGAWIQEIGNSAPPTRLSVSNCADPSLARFLSSVDSTGHSNSDAIKKLKEHFQNTEEIRQFDSQAKYVMLAAGQADLIIRVPPPNNPTYQEKLWDHAAGALIIEEAGGRVSDIDGKPFDFSTGRSMKNNRGVVVTNGLIHTSVIGFFQSGTNGE